MFTVILLNNDEEEGFVRPPHGSQVTGKCDEHGIYWKNADKCQFRFSCELGIATAACLTTELESCRQLHDLEPDNKWVLLTMISLMRALDPVSHYTEMTSYLRKLISIDPLRANYYTDLQSRIVMEVAIENLPANSRSFTLSGEGLSVAYCLEHLSAMMAVDLSNNSLRHLHGVCHLQFVRELNLSNNSLTACEGFDLMPQLEILDLRHNNIKHVESLSALSKSPRLCTVYVAGNPVTYQPDFHQHCLAQTVLMVY